METSMKIITQWLLLLAYLGAFRVVEATVSPETIVEAKTDECISNDSESSSLENVCSTSITEPSLSQNASASSFDDKHDNSQEESEWMSQNCGIILASSSLTNSAGWGVFLARPSAIRGTPVLGGDVVIQVHDLPPHPSLRLLLHSYWWDSHATGGVYEGLRVVSHIPGLGMLSNGLLTTKETNQQGKNLGANILPFVPRVDEGGLTRQDSPGAGSISHYHNYTYFVLHNMTSGDEIFASYGYPWFQERQQKYGVELTTKLAEDNSDDEQESRPGHRPLEDLRREGRCLDSLRADKSTISHAGRGAFARWNLPKSTIVLAVPAIPIAKQALWVQRAKEDKEEVFQGYQLLLNYVLGHAMSSTVLVPFGPLFSLVNHAPSPERAQSYKNATANVRLQWSKSSTLFRHREWLSNNSTEFLWMQNQSGLLLELVATRNIYANEEILLDYGPDFEQAWQQHVQDWSPPPNAESYAPSYVHDDAIAQARTENELQSHPYPDHVFTSCFFNMNETVLKQMEQKNSGSTVTTIQWELVRSMFEYKNLRPCRIAERHATRRKNEFLYTVQILNRYGLRKEERLSSPLVVTHVPRKAIRFSDKIYTTDQHLPNAFRHSIYLPDDVFPDAWKDLTGEENASY